MKLYSYKGQEPQGLPERFRLDDGTTITGLGAYSEKELSSYGFSGPIEQPSFDANTHKLVWNGKQYEVVELNSQELLDKERERIATLTQNIDADHFLSVFKTTLFHSRLRKEASLDLKVNLLYSELINHLRISKNVTQLDTYFDKFFFFISFTDEEIADYQNLIKKFNLDLIYSIPDTDYLSKYQYDFETDSIIDTSTRVFESWIWNGQKWVAPIPYPTDGKIYTWNEKTKKWKKVTIK